MYTRQKDGYGLIEVLIAVAVIAGAGLLVATFISSQTKSQITVRNSSSCQTTVNALAAKVKELDNNTQIDSWLPTTNQMQPVDIEYTSDRAQPIGPTNLPAGMVEENVAPTMMAYNASETLISSRVNAHQLIKSSFVLLARHYNVNGNAEVVVTRDEDNFLSEIVTELVDEDASIAVSVTPSVSTPVGSLVPIPININANASTNSNMTFDVRFVATYEDESGATKTCSTNVTVSPGSDLVRPTVRATVSSTLATSASGVLCGTGGRGNFEFIISQNTDPEIGVMYLCRLDYLQGRFDETGPAQNHDNTSGWFFCSSPETPINDMGITGMTASAAITAVTTSPYSEVRLQIVNAIEGSYRLHVKAVDVARNESPVETYNVLLDVSRPRFRVPPAGSPYDLPAGRVANSPNSNLNGYNFQCSNQLHTDWTVHLDPNAEVEVSDTRVIHSYYAQATMPGPTALTCATAGNLYNGMNAGNTAWLSDGPKTAEFIVCDECNTTLNVPPERQDALWFVDTANGIVGSTPNLVGRSFAMDGGDNHFNPYVINAPQLTAINATTAQVNLPPSVTINPLIRNSYSNRVRTGAITAPTQPIKACLPYGRFGYEIHDGCYNSSNPALTPGRVTTVAPYVYNNADAASNLCGGSGLADNFRYCPTFVVPGGSYAPQACTAPEVGCDIQVDEGYCGFRGPTTCTFKTGLNRACAQPPGCELTNYNGGSLTLPVGTTEYTYITSARGGGGDPCACQQGDFSCRDVGGSVRFVQSVGNAVFSGGTWICGGGQYRVGLQCYQEMPLNTPIFASCLPTELPASCTPPSSCADLGLASCSGCTDGSSGSCYDADTGGGVMCCGTSATCPSGTTECTPGSPGCPATPNGDGLYCASNSCTGTWGYVGACTETHSCSATETPTSITQTQTCSNSDCCGTPETRTCYTGCAAGPTCTHDGNSFEVGQTTTTYTSATVACGSTCSPNTSTCTLSGGTASWSPALGAANSCSVDPCPVDCVGDWGACAAPASNPSACGAGAGVETYAITTAAQYGGDACSASAGQTRPCNLPACAACDWVYVDGSSGGCGSQGGGSGGTTCDGSGVYGPPAQCNRYECNASRVGWRYRSGYSERLDTGPSCDWTEYECQCP